MPKTKAIIFVIDSNNIADAQEAV